MLPSLVTFLAAVAAALAPAHLPPGFRVVTYDPAGGQIWRGAIAGARRAGMIYVPPDYSSGRRYPVIYLLAGMPGSPWSYVRSLSLASVADTLIARGEAAPFVAVIPPAGSSGHYSGEWAGPRVRFFVSTGPGHGHVTVGATVRFARLLRALQLPYRLELLARKRGSWERQLVDGLRWAFESART